MKHQPKNYLKLVILLFGISLLLWNCEKEEIIISNDSLSTKRLNYSLKRINYEQLVEDQEFSGSLKTVQMNLFGTELTQKNSGDVNKIDLSILTEEIIKIETENVITWTFELEHHFLESSDFENLLVKKFNDAFSYFLIVYQNSNDEEKTIEKSILYPIPKEYLDTEVIDVHLKGDALDWVPPADGGGDGDDGGCEGIITTEIEPCDKGGYHEPKYACQHLGGEHGMSDFPPCGEVCSGTTIVTVLDFSHCNDGTYDPPIGPSNDLPSDNPNDGQFGGGGGTTPTDNSTGEPTYTSPQYSDGTRIAPQELISQLNITDQTQIDWVNNNVNTASVDNIWVFGQTNNWSQQAKAASLMTIEALSTNKLHGPYDSSYLNSINQYTEVDLTDPYLAAIWIQHFSAQCAILKLDNSSWSNRRVYWEASKEMIHIGLDIGGLVPVVGEVFDVVNGIIYTIEGDGVNATLSFAATIPIAGWFATGGKYAVKGIWKAVMRADGVIDFGVRNSKKFREALGLVVGDGKHAHHIIPWVRRTHDLVQQAAKDSRLFHPNEVLNGIPLPSSNHLTGHTIYTDRVTEVLEVLYTPGMTPTQAYDALTGFISHLDNLISSNPTLNLGQIADLISYP